MSLSEFIAARVLPVRRATESLAEPLATEDFGIQSMPEVSPPKWHWAHTSWFFENFILVPFCRDYRAFHPEFGFLFNSYYKTVGEHFPRNRRGLMSRPTVAEVREYRAHVDRFLAARPENLHGTDAATMRFLLDLGCHHEQQHQELLLTDILHLFWSNPLKPVYRNGPGRKNSAGPAAMRWHEFSGGLDAIGFEGGGFSFDNERPRHQ
ncbi:MAG: DinB family protein, partial [Candidatus Binatia bacterium]